MKDKARNIAVGLTVLVAMALLAGMILVFTGLPWFMQSGYQIKIQAETTHDAHPGDLVHLAGMAVGRVTDVNFTHPEHPYQGVTISARIEEHLRLPGNVVAQFYTKGIVGAAYIELKPAGPPRLDPVTGRELEFFPTDGSIMMASEHFGASVVPQEVTDAMQSVAELAANISTLIAPRPQSQPTTGQALSATGPAGPVETGGLQGTLEKLNRALDAMSAVFGDAENQQNMKVSLANLAKSSAAATEAMTELKEFAAQARLTAGDFSQLADKSQQRIDELARKVMDSAEDVSQLMATINRIATKIEAGQGTAGKLLTDPQLYSNFLDATGKLNELMEEFRRLVEAWRQRGMEVKLK